MQFIIHNYFFYIFIIQCLFFFVYKYANIKEKFFMYIFFKNNVVIHKFYIFKLSIL
jgi:hypothetical protein